MITECVYAVEGSSRAVRGSTLSFCDQVISSVPLGRYRGDLVCSVLREQSSCLDVNAISMIVLVAEFWGYSA